MTFDILRAHGNESLVHSAIRCNALAATARWVLLGYGPLGSDPLKPLGWRSLEAGLLLPRVEFGNRAICCATLGMYNYCM